MSEERDELMTEELNPSDVEAQEAETEETGKSKKKKSSSKSKKKAKIEFAEQAEEVDSSDESERSEAVEFSEAVEIEETVEIKEAGLTAANENSEDLESSYSVSQDDEDDQNDQNDIEIETSVFLQEETESEGFLPEASDNEESEMEAASEDEVSVEGTELDDFDSAEIEETEFVEEERLESILESVLFASDRPVSLASLKLLFKGTNIRGDKIRRALEQLAVEYAGGRRGVTLEEVPGGYQLRTKIDNMEFLKRTLKTRQFKLSGPALEVLSIVAYKQPTVKAEIDEIRGVESGHLLRALMEKNLVCFEGKSELPGRPMQYGTTRKFLEIFGLRTLKELPTLSQIDELLPEGIDEQQAEEKPTLASITDSMSETFVGAYSQGEEELMKIQEQLEDIATTTNFFEEEKRRQAEKRDQERAQNIRDALAFGEPVSTRDANWLKKYDEALAAGTTLVALAAEKKSAFMKSGIDAVSDGVASPEEGAVNGEKNEAITDAVDEIAEAIAAFDADEDMDEASTDQLLTEDNEFMDEENGDEELPFLGEADDIDEEGEASL
ncbi:MAG: SMC-Scp complex subunit ScpB [Pseudobdellovibrionaceae bacterium]